MQAMRTRAKLPVSVPGVCLLLLMGCSNDQDLPEPTGDVQQVEARQGPDAQEDAGAGLEGGDVAQPSEEEPTALNPELSASAPPAMRRLSASQYRHTLTDWFGEALITPASLEPDLRADGLSAIGASVNGLSSLGVERYVKGAASVAAQLVEYAPIFAA